MKLSLPAALTAIAVLLATLFCQLTIGNVIQWACNRLLGTALPDRENDLTLLIGTNTAVGLLAGVVSGYVAVQFVYAMKSPYIVRERIVPGLAAALTAIAVFLTFSQGPHSVPAWEVLRIDFGLFLVHPPIPLVAGLVAGIFLGHRKHAPRVIAG